MHWNTRFAAFGIPEWHGPREIVKEAAALEPLTFRVAADQPDTPGVNPRWTHHDVPITDEVSQRPIWGLVFNYRSSPVVGDQMGFRSVINVVKRNAAGLNDGPMQRVRCPDL